MKKILLFLFAVSSFSILHAQITKTLLIHAGELGSKLTLNEKLSINDITITGAIDASDFEVMRDSMPNLKTIDLSATSVLEYSGMKGTYPGTDYSYNANAIPFVAFGSHSNLTSVLLPSTITEISDNAFMYCTGIASITIPSHVTYIGFDVFIGYIGDIIIAPGNTSYSTENGVLFNYDKSSLLKCQQIKSGTYTVPATVRTISHNSFYNCDKLTDVIIPNGVYNIDDGAFTNCTGLTSLIIPPSVTAFGVTAFQGCSNIVNIEIPINSALRSLLPSTFLSCSSLKAINIPSSVIEIYNGSFGGNTKLTKVRAFAETPINLANTLKAFDGIPLATCSLYVPKGAKAKYDTAKVWAEFGTITEMAGFIPAKKVDTLSRFANSTDTILIDADIAWTVMCDQSWLTVQNIDNLKLALSASKNDASQRTATVSIMANGVQTKTIQITQRGNPLDSGLVAFYPFNGNTNDSSSYKNDAGPTFATLTTDRFGKPNSAYAFSSTNTLINCGFHATLDPSVTNKVSVSAWVKFSNITGSQAIVGRWGTSPVAYILYKDAANNIIWNINNNANTTVQYPFTTIKKNTWYHIVGTCDNQSVTLYINDIEVGKSAGVTVITHPTENLTIGNESSGPSPFQGVIDDIRIYNRALSKSNVDSIYLEHGWDSPMSGLVAYFPFNGNTKDLSVNGNDGKARNASFVTDRFGKLNAACFLNLDTVVCADKNIPAGNKSRSFSCWYYSDEAQLPGVGAGSLIWYGNETTNNNQHLSVTSGFLRYGGYNNDVDYVATTPIGKWMHVVTTYNGTTASIYVNSKLVATDTKVDWNTVLNGKLFIGRELKNAKIDDIRIYSRAIFQNEIDSLYHEGGYEPLTNGLLAYYPFNANAKDESGNGKDASYVDATLTTDRFGNADKAYSFNGTSNFISVNHAEALNPGIGSFSYGFWVKTSQVDNYTVISKLGSSPNTNGFSFSMYGYKIYWYYKDNSTAWECNNFYMNNSYYDNKYHFYSVVLDRDNHKSLFYMDGKLITPSSVGSSITNQNIGDTSPLTIGTWNGNNPSFKGSLDDIRLYNRVISPTEVDSLYHEGGSWPLTLDVSATSLTIAAPASSLAMVTVTSNTNWTAVSNQPWLSVNPSITTKGNATLTLTATQNTGNDRFASVTVSGNGLTKTIYITQKDPNIHPTASIVSPVYGSYVKADSVLTITANAADADGTIDSVVFSINGIKIGVDKVAPYTLNWKAVSQYSASISATAYDNSGAATIASSYVYINNAPTISPIPAQIAKSDSTFNNFYYSFYVSDDHTYSNNLIITANKNDYIEFTNGVQTPHQLNKSWTGTTQIHMTAKDEQGLSTAFTIDYVQPYLLQKATTLPSGSFTANKTFIHLSDTVKFYPTLFSTDTVIWNFGKGKQVAGTCVNPMVRFDSIGTYSISMKMRNKLGEVISTKNNYIHVSALSLQDTTICKGDSVTISIVGSGYSQYSWNTVPIQTKNLIKVSPSKTTNYKVTLKKGQVTIVDSITIAIPTQPELGKDTTFCDGGSLLLNPGTFSTYYWNGSTTAGNATYSATTSGKIKVRTIDAKGCIASDSVTIGIYSLPTLTANTTKNNICKGISTSVFGSSSSSLSYSWNSGVVNNSLFTPSSTKTYSVTGTDSHGCQGTASTIVSVYQAPTITASAFPTAVCPGLSTVIQGGGGSSYLWNNGVNNAVTYFPTATKTYSVTGIDSHGCQGTSSTTVSVYQAPTITANAFPTAVCPGTSTVFQGGGGSSYLWNNGVNNAVTYFPTATNIYSVTGTDSHGCQGMASTIVAVYQVPTITANAFPTAVCPGFSTVLQGGGGSSYLWNNGVNNAITYFPTISKIYSVTGTDSHGCQGTASTIVAVYQAPTITANAFPTAVCPGLSTVLQGGGGSSYLWNNGVNNAITYFPTTSKIYSVTGTDSHGCQGTASTIVTVYQAPTITANAFPTAVCPGTSTVLQGGGGSSYLWNNGVNNAITYFPTATKTYSVTGTDNHGCSQTASISVEVHALPSISAKAFPTMVCSGDSAKLIAKGAKTLRWETFIGDSVTFLPLSSKSYTVTGTDNYGCQATASTFIAVNSIPTVKANATSSILKTGDKVTLTGSGASLYRWNNAVIDGQAFTPSITTTYKTTGSDGNGCVNTASITVTVIDTVQTKNIVAGSLATVLTKNEKNSIKYLKLTGKIDASDFKTMRDSMPNLQVLDLTNAQIMSYNGNNGTGVGSSNYSENQIPITAFVNKTSLKFVSLPLSATSIANAAFEYCSALDSVTLSPSTSSISAEAFYGTQLSAFTVPSSVTIINNATFKNCTSLKTITIPKSVSIINPEAFSNCTSLETINVFAKVPPTMSSDAIAGMKPSSCKVFVPTGSLAAYTTTKPWSSFFNIHEVDQSFAPYFIHDLVPEQISKGGTFSPIDLQSYITDKNTAFQNLTFTVGSNSVLSLGIVNGIVTPKQIDSTWTGSTTATVTVTNNLNLSTTFEIVFTQPYLLDKKLVKPSCSFYANKMFIKNNQTVKFYSNNKYAQSVEWTFDGGTPKTSSSFSPSITYDSTGTFSVSLKAINSVGETIVKKVGYIIVSALSVNDTTICKGDSITISVVGLGYKSYQWNTIPVQKTKSIKVSPTNTTKYTVTMLKGAAVVVDSVTISIAKQPDLGKDTTFCVGGTRILNPGLFTSYYWNGSTSLGNATFTATTAGKVTVIIVDSLHCTAKDSVIIGTLYPKPIVNIGKDTTFCWKKKMLLNAGNAGATYKWNTGLTSQSIYADTTKSYSVTVTDTKTCTNSDTINIKVIVPIIPTIGVVTQSSTKKNIVAWEPINNKGIKQYRIWRENSASVFEAIKTINKNDSTYYIDETSNPQEQSYRYALSTIDVACNNESYLSTVHSSMHLSCKMTSADSKTVTATWNNYEGIPISKYTVYRAEKGNPLQVYKEVLADKGVTTTFIDDNAIGLNSYYQVSFDLPNKVTPSALKSDSGPFSMSLSNMAESKLVESGLLTESGFEMYPNPATNAITISLSGNGVLEFYSATGIKILAKSVVNNEQISLENWERGFYLVKVQTNDSVYTKTLIIE